MLIRSAVAFVGLSLVSRTAGAQLTIVLPSRVEGRPSVQAPRAPLEPQGNLLQGDALRAAIEEQISVPIADPEPQAVSASLSLVERGRQAFFGSRFREAMDAFSEAGATLREWLDTASPVDRDRVRQGLAESQTRLAWLLRQSGQIPRGEVVLRQLVGVMPNWVPTEREYPPPIIEWVRAIAQQVLAERGSLEVSLSRRGCEILLDGGSVAATSLAGPGDRGAVLIEPIARGPRWVSASCGGSRRMRRHVVNVRIGRRNTVAIDADLDAVLETRPQPALEFHSPSEMERDQERLARVLAEALGAGRVILLQATGGHRIVDILRSQPAGGGESARLPLWPSFAIGGLGAVGAGVGIFLLATNGQCTAIEFGNCVAAQDNVVSGLLTLTAGGLALVGAVAYTLLR